MINTPKMTKYLTQIIEFNSRYMYIINITVKHFHEIKKVEKHEKSTVDKVNNL